MATHFLTANFEMTRRIQRHVM